MSEVTIAAVTPATWPEVRQGVLEIEDLCFPRPWDEATFVDDLKGESGHLDVLRRGAQVLAFCSSRQLYDELHIMQIATHPDARRQGLGAQLMSHAVDRARTLCCQAVLLEVRRSNQAAVALYQRTGFRLAGVRRRYYRDNDEDALVMLLTIAPA